MTSPDDPATPSGWGRIAVHYDIEKWMSCPPAFPAGYDVRSWARTYAEAFSRRPGVSPTPELISALAARLVEIHQDAYGSGRIICHLCLIHQPNPMMSPLPLYMSAWDSRGNRDETLRRLSHADNPAAIQPPYVAEVTARDLGTGLKVRYFSRRPGPPIGALRRPELRLAQPGPGNRSARLRHDDRPRPAGAGGAGYRRADERDAGRAQRYLSRPATARER